MTDLQAKLIYTIKHEPIRYVVNKYLFFHAVETLEGDFVDVYFFARKANRICDLYNTIYQLGYSVGVNKAIKTIFNDTV